VLDTAPVEAVPLVALLPLQPPEAVQEVALVEDQVRVADPPDAMEAGLTLRFTVGGCGGVVGLNVAVTMQLAVMAPVVYVLPLSDPLQPVT
jgi:hypothetical protein